MVISRGLLSSPTCPCGFPQQEAQSQQRGFSVLLLHRHLGRPHCGPDQWSVLGAGSKFNYRLGMVVVQAGCGGASRKTGLQSPEHRFKKRADVAVHAYGPSAGEGETGGPCACWPTSLAYVMSSRPVRDPVSKTT